MQKWEYTWIVVPHNLKNIKVDGNKVPALEYVNEMGEYGWELVAVEQSFPGSGLSDFILFFKRLK